MGVIFDEFFQLFVLPIFVEFEVVHDVEVAKTTLQTDYFNDVQKVLPVTTQREPLKWKQCNGIYLEATIQIPLCDFADICLSLLEWLFRIWKVKDEVHHEVKNERTLDHQHKPPLTFILMAVCCVVDVDKAAYDAQKVDNLMPDGVSLAVTIYYQGFKIEPVPLL